MLLAKKLLLLSCILTGFIHMKAQITAPSADSSLSSKYSNKDTIFVFNRSFYQEAIQVSIFATPIDKTDGWTFQWYIYRPQTRLYEGIGSSTGMISNLDTITVQSGYMVEMIKGLQRDTFRVWIVFNDLELTITNKDEEDILRFGNYNCSSIDLKADTIRPAAYYYNPETGDRIAPGNIYTLRWTSDNSEASTPASRLITRVNKPPSTDTWYIITITDNYGLMRTDSVFYKSIKPKAEITANYIPLTDSSFYPNRWWYDEFYDNGIASAPALFSLDVSSSVNMNNYMINFGDGDSVMIGKDTLKLEHEFKKPGDYKVLLTAFSEYPCTDSMSVTVTIETAKGNYFDMPNVFTPNNSGFDDVFTASDVFRTSEVSVLNIEITIFSRTGLKVHHFRGNIRDWPGWDGRIMNSGREAPEGVYFYVISWLDAFKDKEDPIDKKLLNGFIHLYRN